MVIVYGMRSTLCSSTQIVNFFFSYEGFQCTENGRPDNFISKPFLTVDFLFFIFYVTFNGCLAMRREKQKEIKKM